MKGNVKSSKISGTCGLVPWTSPQVLFNVSFCFISRTVLSSPPLTRRLPMAISLSLSPYLSSPLPRATIDSLILLPILHSLRLTLPPTATSPSSPASSLSRLAIHFPVPSSLPALLTPSSHATINAYLVLLVVIHLLILYATINGFFLLLLPRRHSFPHYHQFPRPLRYHQRLPRPLRRHPFPTLPYISSSHLPSHSLTRYHQRLPHPRRHPRVIPAPCQAPASGPVPDTAGLLARCQGRPGGGGWH